MITQEIFTQIIWGLGWLTFVLVAAGIVSLLLAIIFGGLAAIVSSIREKG